MKTNSPLMSVKLNVGISKKEFKKMGIQLRADLEVVFSHIFIGELILENTKHQALGKPKLTVVNYGAYKEVYPCLVTEFLIQTFDNQNEFINYRYLPCESESEVLNQLKALTQNQTEENATFLGEVLDELLIKYFNKNEKKL